MFNDKINNIHFIGIGGIGMSGMAELLFRDGYSISGTDLTENDRTEHLRKIGINISIGHSEKNIENSNLVVYSSAVKDDNVEIIAAKKVNIPVIKRAEMLSEIVSIKKTSIGIAGTHGKTTTCSMVGNILHHSKKDPTMIIGGIVKNFETNNVSGDGDIIVVEADEYDKSFLSLKPTIAVINNIEEEHLDCYSNISELKKSFEIFINNIPFYGFVLINADDSNIESIIPNIKRPMIKFSLNGKGDYNAENISFNKNRTSFDLFYHGEKISFIELSVPGYHNVYNALSSIAICRELNIPIQTIAKSFLQFKGVRRRFDIKYNKSDKIYIDDYAHHPTEVKVTIDAAKKGWPDKRIISIFQPHLFSRTKIFFKEFARALENSDKIILLDIYGARENKIKGVTSELIFRELKNHCFDTKILTTKNSVKESLRKIYTGNELIITMGAGNLHTESDNIISVIENE